MQLVSVDLYCVLGKKKMENVVKRKNKVLFIKGRNSIPPFSFIERIKLFLRIKRKRPLNYPKEVWIEITNECNLQCIMCPQSMAVRKKQTMDMSAFRKIFDQICVNKPKICLHVAGEPLLNNSFFEMVEYAHNKGCWVGINTNATLLTQEMSKRILQSPLDQISLSFEGCTPAIYEKIRVGAKFKHVKSQIEDFLRLRGIQNKPFAQIEIIKMEETKGSIKDFIQYWQSTGMDRIVVRPVSDWLGLVANREPKTAKKLGYRFCRAIFHQCTILVDGTVVPCCLDFEGRLPLGNVLKQSFKDIWNGSAYNTLRSQHLAGAVPKHTICKNCIHTRCWDIKEQIAEWLLNCFFLAKMA